MIPIIAYADRFSVRAGGSLAVKVSSVHAEYQADLVRIRSADPNPQGPGMKLEPLPSGFAGRYPGRVQHTHLGSWAEILLPGFVPDGDWTLSVRVQPWLLDGRAQAVLGWAGVALHVTAGGAVLRVGDAECRVAAPMIERRWYELRLVASGGQVEVVQRKLQTDWGSEGSGSAVLAAHLPPPQRLVLAATDAAGDHFNGRLEHPMLLRGRFDGAVPLEPQALPRTVLHAWWDFSLRQDTAEIVDQGPHRWHGRLVNMPTRASRGAFWTGREMNWRHAPDEYAAIHFHEIGRAHV